MKTWYDQKARDRKFQSGDKVLLLLPLPGNKLQLKFVGPYTVVQKLNSVDYVISTPDRKREKTCVSCQYDETILR